MRATLVIDDDVLDRAKLVAGRLRSPFRKVVNEALRLGLQTIENGSKKCPYEPTFTIQNPTKMSANRLSAAK